MSNRPDLKKSYDFSDESFVFHEELFWTKAFLRPMVKCITKNGNTIVLKFYLRKIIYMQVVTS